MEFIYTKCCGRILKIYSLDKVETLSHIMQEISNKFNDIVCSYDFVKDRRLEI